MAKIRIITKKEQIPYRQNVLKSIHSHAVRMRVMKRITVKYEGSISELYVVITVYLFLKCSTHRRPRRAPAY